MNYLRLFSVIIKFTISIINIDLLHLAVGITIMSVKVSDWIRSFTPITWFMINRIATTHLILMKIQKKFQIDLPVSSPFTNRSVTCYLATDQARKAKSVGKGSLHIDLKNGAGKDKKWRRQINLWQNFHSLKNNTKNQTSQITIFYHCYIVFYFIHISVN